MIDLVPLGDRAWLARFEDSGDARAWTEGVRAWARDRPGVLDIVLAFQSVAVFADPEREDLEGLEASLRSVLVHREGYAPEEQAGTDHIEVPVLYDGEDLDVVGRRLGLSAESVRTLHCDPIYTVWAVGFLPGFPYCGPLPDPLNQVPRRESPRPRVLSGSVAIAAGQTAIYPRSSPGGWHILGRTPLVIADLESDFFPLRAGDRVRFRPIDQETFRQLEGQRITRPK